MARRIASPESSLSAIAAYYPYPCLNAVNYRPSPLARPRNRSRTSDCGCCCRSFRVCANSVKASVCHQISNFSPSSLLSFIVPQPTEYATLLPNLTPSHHRRCRHLQHLPRQPPTHRRRHLRSRSSSNAAVGLPHPRRHRIHRRHPRGHSVRRLARSASSTHSTCTPAR